MGILSQKNGFIYREEAPDFGVDLDVELITDGKHASAQKFAVQIKSAAKLSLVKKDGGEFFAFPFETSRLNYLRKRDLGFGILVLYDEATENCYFDYVFDLVKRVDAFNPVKDWHAQQKVTIHIAPSQVFDVAAALEIHNVIHGLYERYHLLVQAHGSQFNLPGFAAAAPANPLPTTDFKTPAQLVPLLEQYGGALFNMQEYPMLLDLFSRLPAAAAGASPALAFLAALTYAQVGDLVEGEYYMAKCRQHLGQLDSESLVLLDFARVRLEFLRGSLDVAAYADRINELAAKSSSTLNGLVLRINTVYLTVAGNNNGAVPEQDLATRIAELFVQITESTLDEATKMLLTLYNSESLQILGSSIYLHEAMLIKVQEKAHIVVSNAEKRKRVEPSVARLTQARQYAHEAYRYAQQHADELLRAYAAQYLSRYFLSVELDLMLLQLDAPPSLTPEKEQQYITNFNLAGEAYNLFDRLNLWKDAHQTLCNLAEIQTIFSLLYDQPLGKQTSAEVMQRIRQLESKLGLPAFESIIAAAHRQFIHTLNTPKPLWGSIEEAGTIEAFAHTILSLYKLPEERLPNLVADIESHAFFEAQCKNDRIQLLNNVSLKESPQTAYTEPTSYVLQDKISGIQTPPSTDVRLLLRHFSQLLKPS